MIENDSVFQKFQYICFLKVFYSYSYKCYLVETCFAGLTMIKLIIVNNWFNHYEHTMDGH